MIENKGAEFAWAARLLSQLCLMPLVIAKRDGHYEHNQWRRSKYHEEFVNCKTLGLLEFNKKINSKRHFYTLTETGERILNCCKVNVTYSNLGKYFEQWAAKGRSNEKS